MSTVTRSAGSWVRIGLALLAGIGLVIVGAAALVLVPAALQLFDPAAYKHAMEAQHTYERLPAELAQIAAESRENGAAAGVMRYLDQHDYETIFGTLMPADWPRTQIDSLIDQEFAYLNSDTQTYMLNVSLAPLKDALRADDGTVIITQVVDTWPVCTPAEALQWGEALLKPAKFDPPHCRPADAIMKTATPLFGKVINVIVTALPDAVDLAAPHNGNPPRIAPPKHDPRPAIRLIKIAAAITPVLALILLATVALLIVRSWGSLLRWIGALLLITGIIALVAAIASGLWAEGMFAAMAQRIVDQGGGGAALGPILLETIRYVLRRVELWSGMLSILTGLAGVVMLIASFVMWHPRRLKGRGREALI